MLTRREGNVGIKRNNGGEGKRNYFRNLKVNLSEDMTCGSRNEQCNKQEESPVNGISKVPVYRIQQSKRCACSGATPGETCRR